jgi:hypothetical protein
VVDAGDHERIDESGGRRIRELAGVQEVHDGGERNGADELGDVVAADGDRLGGGLRERRRPDWLR